MMATKHKKHSKWTNIREKVVKESSSPAVSLEELRMANAADAGNAKRRTMLLRTVAAIKKATGGSTFSAVDEPTAEVKESPVPAQPVVKPAQGASAGVARTKMRMLTAARNVLETQHRGSVSGGDGSPGAGAGGPGARRQSEAPIALALALSAFSATAATASSKRASVAFPQKPAGDAGGNSFGKPVGMGDSFGKPVGAGGKRMSMAVRRATNAFGRGRGAGTGPRNLAAVIAEENKDPVSVMRGNRRQSVV